MSERMIFTQAYRDILLASDDIATFRKTSRIVAVEMTMPFAVETDRGLMTGESGDWLVTNHPDDDPGSDLWTISAERMAGTYEPAD